MGSFIYLEGGGDSKELRVRCRLGFQAIFERCGYRGRMPALVVCGGRSQAFDRFTTMHRSNNGNHFVALLVDSEDIPRNSDKTWEHFKNRDGWEQPSGSNDNQVFFMIVCMETWIIADKTALKEHYGTDLQESAIPSIISLENKDRHFIQNALEHATRNCSNAYHKGKRSFEILAKLDPEVLNQLSGFYRMRGILNERL